MCRVLMYLGQPLLLDDLLYQPDSSLIKQSYNPRLMSHMQNIAGFGMATWDPNSHDPGSPFLYKTIKPPFYDINLKRLAMKVQVNCLLAHVRGVPYSETEIVSEQNVHPFFFDNASVGLAHNGNLMQFGAMKSLLFNRINPIFSKQITGTTDSEWIYALLLTELSNLNATTPTVNEVCDAVINTIQQLRQIRMELGIRVASPLNLFISTGTFLVATRFVFDYGCYYSSYKDLHLAMNYNSLWYTYGNFYGYFDNEYKMIGDKRTSIIIASEPLTQDTTTWTELPEYSLMTAYYEKDEIKIKVNDIPKTSDLR